jgi:excinuclease ABC subunit A
VLYSSLAPITGGGKPKLVGCKKILGAENFKRVLEVDQSPIGRTPRSCPATYVGFWTEIRELFASSPDAAIRGYDASRFSFNIEGGRCPECGGQGVVRSEMSFLPDVVSQCPVCGGSRFNEETLAVRYCGKTIADVLAMDVDTALEFFGNHPKLHYSLTLLKEVGLGYLSLGQQSSTLSGGEAQRIKLVAELARCTPKLGQREQATLYVLDEPTVGLHMADVLNLIKVVHKLVEHGHTVIMIEHNHDVVAEADYVLTLER